MCKKDIAIKRFELIEVVVLATTTTEVQFQDVPNLRNDTSQRIVIKDLEVFPVYAQTNSYRNTGTPVFPVTEIPKMGITLYNEGGEWIRYVPVASRIYTQPPAGVASPFQQERVPMDYLEWVAWDKCKLVFNTAPAFVGAQYVVPIGVSYLKYVK